MEKTQISEQMADGRDDSLWALSNQGVIWQINPANGQAAAVISLRELTPGVRRQLQHQMIDRWARSYA